MVKRILLALLAALALLVAALGINTWRQGSRQQQVPGGSAIGMMSAALRQLARTLRSLYPDTLVVPGLMVAATDSRHFPAISDHIYRFSPVHARPEDLARFHGTNERIATANLAEMVRFYRQLLRNLSAKAP